MNSESQSKFDVAAQMLAGGNNNGAIPILEQILVSGAESSEVYRALAEAHLGCGDFEKARRYCERSVAIDPEYHRGFFLLGVICANVGDVESSISSLERAVELYPDYLDAVRALAAVAAQSGRRDRALPCYRKLIASGVFSDEILLEYAETAEHERAFDEAIMAREELLRRNPDDDANRFNLSSLNGENTPSATPRQMVINTFDEYAERFESHLENLCYRGPELLFNALVQCGVIDEGNEAALSVLDMGCGTGLCGQRFRSVAARLVGVDLSQKMLDEAQKKDIYDELHCDDLISLLTDSGDEQYDLILAADTLIYFGDLSPLFSAAWHRVVPGGCFAMTVERDDESDFNVSRNHRYLHSSEYVRRVARETGWHLKQWTDGVIRQEHRRDLAGFVVVLQRN